MVKMNWKIICLIVMIQQGVKLKRTLDLELKPRAKNTQLKVVNLNFFDPKGKL